MKKILGLIFWVGLLSVRVSYASNCNGDQLSARFCGDIAKLSLCFSNRIECDDVSYTGGAMARSMYYLGRVEASLQALAALGQLQGETYLKFQELLNLLNTRSWWAVSVDGNYLATINEMNRIIEEVRDKHTAH